MLTADNYAYRSDFEDTWI